TSGLALRLRYHIGFFSLPARDAATITRSLSRRKYTGLTRAWPVLRPVVVSSATGIFWNVPPSPSPPPRRYMNVLTRDIHFMKKAVIGELRNRGGDFGMAVILCSAGGHSFRHRPHRGGRCLHRCAYHPRCRVAAIRAGLRPRRAGR